MAAAHGVWVGFVVWRECGAPGTKFQFAQFIGGGTSRVAATATSFPFAFVVANVRGAVEVEEKGLLAVC